jgi:hypothetical protein
VPHFGRAKSASHSHIKRTPNRWKKCPFPPCQYISCQHQAIQKHCRTEHQWVNQRKRGRQHRNQEITHPWIPVYCQQFSPKGSGSAFFEVQGGPSPAISSEGVDLKAIKEELGQAMVQASKTKNQQITKPDEAKEVNLWVSRMWLAEHLGGFIKPELQELVAIPEEDEVDGDNPWDLQAGHGTHVAGMIYARELMEGDHSIISRREKFRRVSHMWHCFLGFPSAYQGVGMSGRAKLKRQVYEEEMQDAQIC